MRVRSPKMLDTFPEVRSALDALAREDAGSFVRLFWDAENQTCEDSDVMRCSLNYLDGWLLNGFKFFVEFIAKVQYLEILRTAGAANVEVQARYVALDAYAFVRYCERFNLTLDQALAMLAPDIRAYVISKIRANSELDLEGQVEALKITQSHYTECFHQVEQMYVEPGGVEFGLN